ncbi:Uncharacterized protein FKW44_000075 [Caligus rogercresseyi]|uniref:Tc1-like transposase DDE domain-containing protein n=1 Tax=Caligus rogercresseyi TaxID=217165 RepID=A0A7T8KGZ6_CALRO|nr:Uncharacterized protein FKW44_000075 [Caligus rogercresseyi]
MKKTAGERKYTFQQDSAPAHKAKTVQNYLEANTTHFWPPTFWPANSPDLNPCDFYLWGRVEGIACNTYHKSTVSFKASIKHTMASLDPREVSKAVKQNDLFFPDHLNEHPDCLPNCNLPRRG